MIERDTLELIPNIKNPANSKICYRQGIEKAMKNYCDTLIENLSDVYLIGIPTIEKREKLLTKHLYELEAFCRKAFDETYRH